jgi:hypothetical protein
MFWNTNRQGWVAAKGLVYSAEWIEPSRNDRGHYNVVFSYNVDGEFYTGEFTDYGTASEEYLHRDDSVDILYDPNSPKHSFYSKVSAEDNRPLIALGIVGAMALIAMLIIYLIKR